MKVLQALLKHDNQSMTTWIEAKAGVKEGCFVTLKEQPDVLWKVEQLYSRQPVDSGILHSDWNVGGLAKRHAAA